MKLNTAEMMILKAARWVAWNYQFTELEDRLNEVIDESEDEGIGPGIDEDKQ